MKTTLLKSAYLLTAILLMFTYSNFYAQVSEIEIEAAPNTLNILSQGKVVTIHTDIKFYEVVHQEVYLNGIEIYSWKSDNQGYFVAKFLMDEVKNLFEFAELPTEADLTLIGTNIYGETFSGTTQITVVNNLPSKN